MDLGRGTKSRINNLFLGHSIMAAITGTLAFVLPHLFEASREAMRSTADTLTQCCSEVLIEWDCDKARPTRKQRATGRWSNHDRQPKG